MKYFKICVCLLWASLLSCEDAFDFYHRRGYLFDVGNRSDQSYESAKFYIGKYENNGVFVPTDSLIEDKILAVDSIIEYGYELEYGWIVDFNKIRPNRGSLLMKLSDGTDFYFFEFSEPYDEVVKGGTFNIYLEKDSIYTTG